MLLVTSQPERNSRSRELRLTGEREAIGSKRRKVGNGENGISPEMDEKRGRDGKWGG